jgi:hypothetical protein
MPLHRGLGTGVLLLSIAAACSTAPVTSASISGSPGSPSPAESQSASATVAASDDASPSAASSPSASGAIEPPDFAEAPLWVRNRDPLPFCGTETQPSATLALDVRRCFVEAAAQGEPAEMLVRATTIEGGTVHYLYRTTPGNPFEQIIDGTGDSFGSGRWERQVCIRLTRGDPVPGDPVGALNFGFESCEDGTPPL